MIEHVVDAGTLESVELLASDVGQQVVLPAEKVALDVADQPALKPLRLPASVAVDDAGIETLHGDILVVETQPEDADGGILATNLDRREERELEILDGLLSRDESRGHGYRNEKSGC